MRTSSGLLRLPKNGQPGLSDAVIIPPKVELALVGGDFVGLW
jgi:hypothetical protein